MANGNRYRFIVHSTDVVAPGDTGDTWWYQSEGCRDTATNTGATTYKWWHTIK